jgi:hypothetical protein
MLRKILYREIMSRIYQSCNGNAFVKSRFGLVTPRGYSLHSRQ